MIKENATQRVERIKKEKSGLDVLADIKRYATTKEAINPEDIDRFKWYGLYTQNKNSQDEFDESLYFMLRVKLEKGAMSVEQMRAISDISDNYAKQTATFTTRQDIQFHNVSVENLPTIFEKLQNVGLSTVFAAGDVPRNVVTCPVSGIEHDEIIDVNHIVSSINDYFRGNNELANLPRKYKVGVSGCSKHCIGHEIQDLSFSAVNFEDGIFFDVSVGGGLASNKQITIHLGYVKEENILKVVDAVSYIYKNYGLRENRKKARLGHLVNEWSAEKFKGLLETKIEFKLENKNVQNYTPYSKREHFGVHKSKKDGYSYIGCAINGGKIGAKGLAVLADSLEKYQATTIKVTNTQNFVILDVPNNNVDFLVRELQIQKIDTSPSSFKARTISCTGIEFCKFAIVETKDQAMKLVQYLEKRFPNFNETISISINGCPNSCAHPHVVDIGLLAIKFKDEDSNTIAGFELILGGNLEGEKSSFGEKTKLKIKPSQVNEVVEKIILSYQNSSIKVFNQFVKEKITDEKFITNLLES